MAHEEYEQDQDKPVKAKAPVGTGAGEKTGDTTGNISAPNHNIKPGECATPTLGNVQAGDGDARPAAGASSLLGPGPSEPLGGDLREVVQRILAGCDVASNGHEVVNALLDARQRAGLSGARRAWETLHRADPTLPDLAALGNFYPDVAALNALQTPDRERYGAYPFTDAGQGELIADLFAGRLRAVPGMGWHVWTGQRWQRDDRGVAEQYAKAAARVRQLTVKLRPMPEDPEERRQAQEKQLKDLRWANRAEDEGRASAALSWAFTERALVVMPEALDTDPWLLNAGNGTVNLHKGELYAGRRSDLMTKTTPVPYFPDAPAPRWELFLREIFDGDTDLIDWIQRAVGYSLVGSTNAQCFFLCHGIGANGKSTMLATLRRLLGEYAADAPFTTFEHGRQTEHGNEIARLRGARLVTSSETEDGVRLNEARIKAITGDSAMTARFLYHEHFTFRPTFKVWLACNHRPVIRGNDLAIWRRVRLIPFTRTFVGGGADPDLETKLEYELPGILAWAVRGCLAWQQQGLDAPPAVKRATELYRQESDIVGRFLAECAVESDGAIVKAGELYDTYKAWAEENGLQPMSSVRFGRDILDRGFERTRAGGAGYYQYHGVGLLAEREGCEGCE